MSKDINRILIADDSEMNRAMLAEMLGKEYEILEAVNGEEAIAMLHQYEGGISLIMLDIMMPVMNGYEAAKMIRSLDREDAKVIPIIAMTANAFTEDKMRAKEAGMDEHIAKPVDGKLLVKVINELVKRDQREKL